MGYNDEQQQDSRETEAMRKLFIGGINRATQEDAFANHFSQFGEIVDKVIMVDPNTKESRGFGFITYASSEFVEEAFRARPHNLDGKTLDIKRAMPREFNTPGAHSKTKKLFIGGIGPDLTEDGLRGYIESRHPTNIGRLESIVIMKDRDTGKNKGFGFLECSDNDFADRLAISESECFIQGKKMNIKKAEPKEGEEDSSGGGGRGGGRGGMRGGRGGRGASGGDRGGRGSFRGRGAGRGGYNNSASNDNYGNNQSNYSTAYPMQQQQGGYSQGQGGYGGGYTQEQGGYGGGYGANTGGYGQAPAAGAGGGGGYQSGGYQSAPAPASTGGYGGGYGGGQQQQSQQGGGYAQGGYPAKTRGGGNAGGQRYQPY